MLQLIATLDSQPAFALCLFPHIVCAIVPLIIVWLWRRRFRLYLRDWFVATLVVAVLMPVLISVLSPAAIYFTSGIPLGTILARFWLRINMFTTCAIVATLSGIVAWVIPMGASRTNNPQPQGGSPLGEAGPGKMVG